MWTHRTNSILPLIFVLLLSGCVGHVGTLTPDSSLNSGLDSAPTPTPATAPSATPSPTPTPVWGTQFQLAATTDGASSARPRVAIDSAGNVLALWATTSPGPAAVQARYFSASSGTWSSTATLASVSASSVDLAMNSGGAAVATWYDGSAVAASIFSPTTQTWSAAQALESSAGAASRAGIDGAGSAWVIWGRLNDALYYSKFSVGTGSWSAAQSLSANSSIAYASKIAVSESGKIAIVFDRTSGGLDSVGLLTYDGSSWAEQYLDASAAAISNLNLAMDANGNAIFSYERTVGGFLNLYAGDYRASTATASSGVLLESLNSNVGATEPAGISMDPTSGKGMVTWGQSSKAYAATYSLASGWGTATIVGTGSTLGRTSVVNDSAGNAMAFWVSTGAPASIQSSAYDSVAGTWSASAAFATHATNAALPSAAINASGRMAVIWLATTSNGFYVRLFR